MLSRRYVPVNRGWLSEGLARWSRSVLGSPSSDVRPAIRADGVNLFYISSARAAALMSGRQPNPSGGQISGCRCPRVSPTGGRGPVNLGPTVNSPANGLRAILSDDAEVLFPSDGLGQKLRK
jgi:hypothetical protein